jgi:hypothetical protein
MESKMEWRDELSSEWWKLVVRIGIRQSDSGCRRRSILRMRWKWTIWSRFELDGIGYWRCGIDFWSNCICRLSWCLILFLFVLDLIRFVLLNFPAVFSLCLHPISVSSVSPLLVSFIWPWAKAMNQCVYRRVD